MSHTQAPIRCIHDPDPLTLASSPEGFMNQLGGPAMITVSGQDQSRCRAICTLLHGNEPSGLRAVHRWLRSGGTPAVNIICFVISVEAALCDSLHKHRILPGQRDMNRCFAPPYDDYNGRIAEQMLQLLETYQPECLIDIHNTSGFSPAFGVATAEDPAHEALISLFTRHLIVTDLTLGALMEISRPDMPVITVECGGAADPRSDELAIDGLARYLFEPHVLRLPREGLQIELYRHPIRFELHPDSQICYAEAPVPDMDLTIPPQLEKHNFGNAPEGTLIGWLGERCGKRILRVENAVGRDRFDDFFLLDGNRILTARPLKLFMVTLNPEIALSDCLLYASCEREQAFVADSQARSRDEES